MCVIIYDMDYKIILDIALACALLLGGWVFKMVFGYMKEMRDQHNALLEKTRQDYRELQGTITELALSIPEKYVSKDDFGHAMKSFGHRFDRLEEKLDAVLSDNKNK